MPCTMEISEIQLYNSLRPKLGDQETQDFIRYVKSTVKNEFMEKEEKFLTKDDKVDLTRSIFLASVVNYVAVLATLLGIVTFTLNMLNK